jgi:hypothetical protein
MISGAVTSTAWWAKGHAKRSLQLHTAPRAGGIAIMNVHDGLTLCAVLLLIVGECIATFIADRS